MIFILSKQADQISPADIQELINSEAPESEQIEYKESLPTDDGSPDRWVTHGDRIGRRAKSKILEETVAFANAYGGALVLGVAESVSNPPVADRITPIPSCANLAERLKLVFRDGVEPQIPALEAFAVPTANDRGVVIIRVGKSRMAPHRVKQTRECTIRRYDRCERMSMREIQDLTLNLAKGTARIERRLDERAHVFSHEFQRLVDPNSAFGFRVTGMPIVDEIRFDCVYGLDAVYRPPFKVTYFGESGIVHPVPSPWRPALRAARTEWSLKRPPNGTRRIEYEEVHCDGLVECAMISCESEFETAVPVRFFSTAAFWSHVVRCFAGAATVEYAIDVEIHVRGVELPVRLGYRHRGAPRIDWRFNSELKVGTLKESPVKFPRYLLSGDENISRLVAVFERDFWHSIGVECELNEDQFLVEPV